MYFSNGKLTGIPTVEDIGPLTLQLKTPGTIDETVSLRIAEDDSNPCGAKETTWVEVIYNEKASIEKQVEAAWKVANTLGVGIDTIRVSL